MSVPFITPMALSNHIITPTEKVRIVDVRDHDHIGGHIRTSHHQPSSTLPESIPRLLDLCEDADTVVFHCALSQQRGPAAAKAYEEARRERENARQGKIAGKELDGKEGREENAVKEGKATKEQKVFVLERGFVGWQEIYGTDKRLTDAYVPDLWMDDY